MRLAITAIMPLGLIACGRGRPLNQAPQTQSSVVQGVLEAQAATPGECIKSASGDWTYFYRDTLRGAQTMVRQGGTHSISITVTSLGGVMIEGGTVDLQAHAVGWFDPAEHAGQTSATFNLDEMQTEW